MISASRLAAWVAFVSLAGCGHTDGFAPPLAHATLFAGANVTNYSFDVADDGGSQAQSLSVGPLDSSLATLRGDGVTWVEIVCRVAMATATATTLDPEPHALPDADLLTVIRHAQAAGLTPVLKPHIYIGGSGTGRAQIGATWGAADAATEGQWFRAYQNYVLGLAKTAAAEHLPALVIATELPAITVDTAATGTRRADAWRQLAAAVRSVYDGKLIYASNAATVGSISWWDAMDVIGVDAYYTLTSDVRPSLDAIVSGWTANSQPGTRHALALSGNGSVNIVEALGDISATFGKPVWLTEIGYRSSDGAASLINQESLNWVGQTVDDALQADLYRGLFEAIQDRPWLEGVFLWFWYPGTVDVTRLGYLHQHAFQGKPAEAIVRAYFGN